jgi:hypothetical protein
VVNICAFIHSLGAAVQVIVGNARIAHITDVVAVHGIDVESEKFDKWIKTPEGSVKNTEAWIKHVIKVEKLDPVSVGGAKVVAIALMHIIVNDPMKRLVDWDDEIMVDPNDLTLPWPETLRFDRAHMQNARVRFNYLLDWVLVEMGISTLEKGYGFMLDKVQYDREGEHVQRQHDKDTTMKTFVTKVFENMYKELEPLEPNIVGHSLVHAFKSVPMFARDPEKLQKVGNIAREWSTT